MDGRKYTTWRIGDEKNISVGDKLSLCFTNGTEFAKAEVIGVNETTFDALTDEEKGGHEKFPSDEEMYTTYSRYYKMEVTPKTKLKIIKFRLIL
jgi:hypothetical protein